MGLGILNHMRRPDNAAAGVIPSQNRHDHAIIGADIFKAAEHIGGNIDNIPLM